MQWKRVMRWMQRRITARDHEMRLDRWLRQEFPHVSQSFIQQQLRQRKLRYVVEESHAHQVAKAHTIVEEGSVVAIDAFAFEKWTSSVRDIAETSKVFAESPVHIDDFIQELMQRVLYKDPNFVVLHKAHGLAVQDGSCLDRNLASSLPALGVVLGNQDNAPMRLVHRLDKETSGVLVLARHRLAAARFSEMLRMGQVHKKYEALVRTPKPSRGALSRTGEITLPVQNKPSHTIFRTVDSHPILPPPGTQWLELEPLTGRKHQLRIHCANALHAPIVGDRKYGSPHRYNRHSSSSIPPRLFLHAKRIRFDDPFNGHQHIDVGCVMDPSHHQ